MPLQYRVIPNPLTVEPSYRADVIHDVLNIQDVITLTSVILPQVGSGTISLVMDALRSVIANEMNSGKSVNLDGFLRFYPSIPGRLVSSDDTTSSANVQINCSVSSNFENLVKTNMSVTKTPYIEKVPVISSVIDASGSSNYLGTILTIKGDGLDFTPTDSTQGVFITKTLDDSSQAMTTYASVTNGQIVGLNDMITEPISNTGNEFLLNAKVRYTLNGNLRTGTYHTPLRYTRIITDTNGTRDNSYIFNSFIG